MSHLAPADSLHLQIFQREETKSEKLRTVFWSCLVSTTAKEHTTVRLDNPELIGAVGTALLMMQYLRAARLHPAGSRMRLLRITGAVLLPLTNRKDFVVSLGLVLLLLLHPLSVCTASTQTRVFVGNLTRARSSRGRVEPNMKLSTGPLSLVMIPSNRDRRLPAPSMPFLIVPRPSSFRRAEQANRPICYGKNKGKDTTSKRPDVGVLPQCFLPFLLSREAARPCENRPGGNANHDRLKIF